MWLGSLASTLSLGSLVRSVGVVGFTRVHSRSHWVYSQSLGSIARPGGLWVIRGRRGRAGAPWVVLLIQRYWAHFRVQWGSLGSLVRALGVIRVRWVNSRAPWGSYGIAGGTRKWLGSVWVHPGSLCPLARALGVVGLICGRSVR